jgi:cytochrome c biogenesis protein CcdA
MKKHWFIIAAVCIILGVVSTLYLGGFFYFPSGTEILRNDSIPLQKSEKSDTISAYYFYGDGCSHCANIKPFLTGLADKYPNLDLHQLEVYHNTINQNLFSRFQQIYGITSPGVPTLFVGDRALVGETQIRQNAEQIILQVPQSMPSPTSAGAAGITPEKPGEGCPSTVTSLTLPLVVTCALIDSINPCAFAVLVFLLLSIITLESRRRILAVGCAYIIAVFSFYLLSGIGLFAIFQQSGFSSILFLAAAMMAIILGLVNVIDVVYRNEGFILAIPASKKELIEGYIRTASLPAAFVLGILVGIFELPCTGGIYLTILGLLSTTLSFSEGLPYLVLYNVVFVLPLIAILIIVAFWLSPETVNSWRLENRQVLRLVIGLAMITIGVFMMWGWL